MNITFQSDKVSLRGPKVDNSYTVSFEVGEYELEKIKDLVTLNSLNQVITVKITTD